MKELEQDGQGEQTQGLVSAGREGMIFGDGDETYMAIFAIQNKTKFDFLNNEVLGDGSIDSPTNSSKRTEISTFYTETKKIVGTYSK
jgi:hypothetical protein